jgi:hypothetical protein
MKYLIPIILVAVVVLIALVATQNPNFGSIDVSQEYNATTTEDMTVNEKHFVNAYALGQVTVASTSPGSVTLYDATSTNAWTITNTAEKIGTLENSISEGTYVFDAKIDDGLVVDLPSDHAGSYIILYR